MNIFLLSFLLLLSVKAFYLSSAQNNLITIVTNQPNNIGFNDQTGPGVRGDQLKIFKQFVAAGSNQYRDNNKDILQYINKGMQNYFGNSTKVYDVMLMTNNSYINFDLQTVFGQYATISTGVDQIHSTYSYGFASHMKNSRLNLVQKYIEQVDTKGSGIDSTKYQKIKNLILKYQDDSSCGKGLYTALQNLDGQRWTIMCTCFQTPNLKLFIYAHNDQWVFTKPKRCYYGLWVYAIY